MCDGIVLRFQGNEICIPIYYVENPRPTGPGDPPP